MENNTSRECDIYTTSDDCHYLLTSGPDYISTRLRNGEVWEAFTVNACKKLTEDIDSAVLIDIGANLGAWSVPMSKHVSKKNGTVYSYEPQRQVYNQLCGNIFLNKITNCFTSNSAIGDHNGEIDVPVLDAFADANLGALSLDLDILKEQRATLPEKTVKVQINTLNNLNLPLAHLVKIDVEGMELEVLTGGKEWLIKSGYPYILFEAWGDYMKSTIEKKKKILALLKDELGYDVLEIGELYVAQHSKNPGPKVFSTENGYKIKKETVMYGMDFLSM